MECEDEFQIRALAGSEGGPGLLRRPGKMRIEEGDIAAAQKLIGRRQVSRLRIRRSCGKRPCQVRKFRSLRPRACGE